MSDPCEHESCGEIRGMAPAVHNEAKKLVWRRHFHLCRLCRCLYVETVPEGDGNEITLETEGQDGTGAWYRRKEIG